MQRWKCARPVPPHPRPGAIQRIDVVPLNINRPARTRTRARRGVGRRRGCSSIWRRPAASRRPRTKPWRRGRSRHAGRRLSCCPGGGAALRCSRGAPRANPPHLLRAVPAAASPRAGARRAQLRPPVAGDGLALPHLLAVPNVRGPAPRLFCGRVSFGSRCFEKVQCVTGARSRRYVFVMTLAMTVICTIDPPGWP